MEDVVGSRCRPAILRRCHHVNQFGYIRPECWRHRKLSDIKGWFCRLYLWGPSHVRSNCDHYQERKSRQQVGYTGEYTMRLKPDYSQFNIMNSKIRCLSIREMQKKGWLNFSELSNASESGVYGKMYELLHTYDPVTQQFGLLNTPLSRANYLRDAEMRNTDWFDLLFNTNVMHNHSSSPPVTKPLIMHHWALW